MASDEGGALIPCDLAGPIVENGQITAISVPGDAVTVIVSGRQYENGPVRPRHSHPSGLEDDRDCGICYPIYGTAVTSAPFLPFAAPEPPALTDDLSEYWHDEVTWPRPAYLGQDYEFRGWTSP